MAALEVRLVWLMAISQRLRAFVEQGGEPGSTDSIFLAALLFIAVDDLTEAVRKPAMQEKPFETSSGFSFASNTV